MKINRRKRRRKSIVISVLFISILFVLSSFIFFPKVNAGGGELGSRYKRYYSSHKIEEGESLSSLTEIYNNTELSPDEYKALIMELNGLSDENLYPGCYLSLVYYKLDK